MTQHQTAEQVTEILARELYVRQATAHAINTDKADREARDEWYRIIGPHRQNEWRQRAELLQAALADSNLAVTWVAP